MAPPLKRPRFQVFAGTSREVTDDASLRALLVDLHEAVCDRLEAMEALLLALESRFGHVEEKLSLVLLGRYAGGGGVAGAPTVSMQAGSPWGVTHSSMKVRRSALGAGGGGSERDVDSSQQRPTDSSQSRDP
ncbi:protein BANP-like [Lampetra planeri]